MNRYILSDLKTSFTYKYVKKTTLYLVAPNDSEVGGKADPYHKILFHNFEDCINYCAANFEYFFQYKIERDGYYQHYNFDISYLYQKINKWNRIVWPCINNHTTPNYRSSIRPFPGVECIEGNYYGFDDGPCFFIEKITQIH